MYKTMSRVNIKQPKKLVKNVVKKEPEIKEVIKEVIPSHLFDEINEKEKELKLLRRELEANNEILDNTFKISHQQEDRIKQLSKKIIERDKIEITKHSEEMNKRTNEIEDIIEKSEIMLKKISKPVVKREVKLPTKTVKREIKPLVRKSSSLALKPK
jgi:hypothetical protein